MCCFIHTQQKCDAVCIILQIAFYLLDTVAIHPILFVIIRCVKVTNSLLVDFCITYNFLYTTIVKNILIWLFLYTCSNIFQRINFGHWNGSNIQLQKYIFYLVPTITLKDTVKAFSYKNLPITLKHKKCQTVSSHPCQLWTSKYFFNVCQCEVHTLI